MKIFSTGHDFNYSWEQVTAANWQKYPNELATHVVSVDILNREIDAERNVLRTERLIACKQAIPSWLRAIVGGDEYSYVREISEVDLNTKTLTMKSANMTMCNLLLVKETVTYSPDPKMPSERTRFEQEAEITAFLPFSRLCNKIEEWSVERFGQNASIGKRGFEGVLLTLSKTWIESELYVKDVSSSILKEVNQTLMKEIDDVNDKTQEVIQEVTDKTQEVIQEVSEKTHEVILEVSEMTQEVIIEVSEKTHEVINEVTVKTTSVLSAVSKLRGIWSRN